jgi:hypothetical protein
MPIAFFLDGMSFARESRPRLRYGGTQWRNVVMTLVTRGGGADESGAAFDRIVQQMARVKPSAKPTDK